MSNGCRCASRSVTSCRFAISVGWLDPAHSTRRRKRCMSWWARAGSSWLRVGRRPDVGALPVRTSASRRPSLLADSRRGPSDRPGRGPLAVCDERVGAVPAAPAATPSGVCDGSAVAAAAGLGRRAHVASRTATRPEGGGRGSRFAGGADRRHGARRRRPLAGGQPVFQSPPPVPRGHRGLGPGRPLGQPAGGARKRAGRLRGCDWSTFAPSSAGRAAWCRPTWCWPTMRSRTPNR